MAIIDLLNTIEQEQRRQRVEQFILFIQGGEGGTKFKPPFDHSKIQSIIDKIMRHVNYNGSKTVDEVALLIKSRVGPSYVTIMTNTALIDVMMAERAFLELIKEL